MSPESPLTHFAGFDWAKQQHHVVIVNETLARRLWPGQDPVGRMLVVPRFEGRLWQVVGVAKDSKYLAVFEKPLPHLYFATRQAINGLT